MKFYGFRLSPFFRAATGSRGHGNTRKVIRWSKVVYFTLIANLCVMTTAYMDKIYVVLKMGLLLLNLRTTSIYHTFALCHENWRHCASSSSESLKLFTIILTHMIFQITSCLISGYRCVLLFPRFLLFKIDGRNKWRYENIISSNGVS